MPPKKEKKPLKRTTIKRKKYVSKKNITEQWRAKSASRLAATNSSENNKKKLGNGSEKPTRNRIKYKRKKSGEFELFKEIWEEREHKCQVTGYYIHEFDIRCFSHILSKGSYPSYRLDKRNIWIVLPDVHHMWEFGDRKHTMFDEKRKVMEELKREYYNK